MPNLLSFLRKPSSFVSFQFLSDLHLEVGQQYESYKLPVSAPYLILAGDIGRLSDYVSYLSFLESLCPKFEKVFLVLGNHEFYNITYEKGIELARKLEDEPVLEGKLLLLHQQRFDIPNSNVTVLGCSLWSHIEDSAREVVAMKVNDFKKIENWTVDSHNAAHFDDLSWLKEEVSAVRKENISMARLQKKPPGKRSMLVITHHAPCIERTSEPRLVGSPWNGAFATDLLTAEHVWDGVKTWIFGDTHYSTEFTMSNIRIVSNQQGYVLPGAQMKAPDGCGKGDWKAFDASKVLKLC
ncbi:hypothetical protein EJ08DRAFT_394568 [Tothia fuscella]|uniref:Calcineurin-like phosphoesterase domain-containing protein n=1 Tax=Tothia fuscella TaxID=1048955 RepID=A0A9P4U208_9PEZI|nr:hypothetical protein EJ08DRAFT_394568 [Tothia fuscella]